MQFRTVDASAGGTVMHVYGYKGTEFEMQQMENEVIEFPNSVIIPSGHHIYINRPVTANDLYYSINGYLGVPKSPMVDWYNRVTS